MNREMQPVILTASRATDLPAYYGEWFMNRMRAGKCEWINPFNREKRTISFARMRAVVFWTKNAAPFLKYLDEFDSYRTGYYFTYTINDYEAEGWEPNIPPLSERLGSFLTLAARLGSERVVWRMDPLILSDRLKPDELLRRFEKTGTALCGHTRSVVVSFVDIGAYRKVARNLSKVASDMREFEPEEMDYVLKAMQKMCHGWGMKLGLCSEQDNWSSIGVRPGACVDGMLLRKLYPADKELMEYLSPPRARDIFTGEYDSVNRLLKDRGQRKNCQCITSKDIGAYDTCPAGCLYCYANSTAAKISRNHASHNPAALSIV